LEETINNEDVLPLVKYLDSINDASLWYYTAAEELTNTDLTKGLIAMLDVYEDAINSYYHDIVDAIELWIYEKANAEIEKELDKRINLTYDKILEEKYREWKQNIDFA
jgi:hypothetical protein